VALFVRDVSVSLLIIHTLDVGPAKTFSDSGCGALALGLFTACECVNFNRTTIYSLKSMRTDISFYCNIYTLRLAAGSLNTLRRTFTSPSFPKVACILCLTKTTEARAVQTTCDP
jgi:hypothetical protein